MDELRHVGRHADRDARDAEELENSCLAQGGRRLSQTAALPGVEAEIILDATLIRAVLAPALMRLLGGWNWWLPQPAARRSPRQRTIKACQRVLPSVLICQFSPLFRVAPVGISGEVVTEPVETVSQALRRKSEPAGGNARGERHADRTFMPRAIPTVRARSACPPSPRTSTTSRSASARAAPGT